MIRAALIVLLLIFSANRLALAETTIIDFMLVYDTEAAAWVNQNGGMEAFSEDAVNRMNLAAENTGLNLDFRHVHSMAVDYTSKYAQTGRLADDLEALQGREGNLAAAHSARDLYGADLVAMLVDTGSATGVGGIGYLLSSMNGQPDHAFSVSAIRAVDIGHILAHETGHNLGAHHSRFQADDPGPNRFLDGQYSAGWYFTGTDSIDYHTIMAYNYDGYGNFYQSAPVFSSPLITWQGTSAGDSGHGDNARLIRETKNVVAAYRELATQVLSGVDQTVLVDSSRRIIGTGARETLEIEAGISVSFTAGDGDRVNLAHNLDNYAITSTGNQLRLTDETGHQITLIVTGTSTVGFANGDTALLEIDFSPEAMPRVLIGGAPAGNEPMETTLVSTESAITAAGTSRTRFSGGSGTPEDPYIIQTAEQLHHVSYHPFASFRLEATINMEATDRFMPIGTPSEPFTGEFDGNGHIIKNLFIDAGSMDNVGLFGFIENAAIHNIGLENADIRGGNRVGGLVGTAIDATISGCFVTGWIQGQIIAGGLVGHVQVGSYSSISDSYTDCNVEGSVAVGGIAGYLGYSASIHNTYAAGIVRGRFLTGGLVGHNSDRSASNVTGSFWDTDTGPPLSSGGTGKSAPEMMKRETFTGWDFHSTWTMEQDGSYPRHRTF